MDEKRHYCDCLEGETAISQERVDVMTCAEMEKRRGLLNGQKGPTYTQIRLHIYTSETLILTVYSQASESNNSNL